MKLCDNYESKIWLGLREGYTDIIFDEFGVSEFIKSWCTEKGQCVTLTPTNFIYKNGDEPGLIVGFINYPRYPFSQAEIKNRTIELAKLLMDQYKEFRVSCTFYPSIPNGTMMLEQEDLE